METVTRALHTYVIDPLVGPGVLVMPARTPEETMPSEVFTLEQIEQIKRGTLLAPLDLHTDLQNTELDATLAELDRLGFGEAEDDFDGMAPYYVGSVIADGREVVALAARHPIIDLASLAQIAESIAEIRRLCEEAVGPVCWEDD